MHHFKVYKQDDKYVYEEVLSPFKEDGTEDDQYWDWVGENEILLVPDEDIPNLICLIYNGEWLSYIHTWSDLEEEFEEKLVFELRANGSYREIEYSDDPDDDDQLDEWQVFLPQVILLSNKD